MASFDKNTPNQQAMNALRRASRTVIPEVGRGECLIIRCDGTETRIQQRPTVGSIRHAIKADMLDTVILTREDGRAKVVMMIDDTGLIDGKPENPKATAYYRSICVPGSNGTICGDVVLVNDEDF